MGYKIPHATVDAETDPFSKRRAEDGILPYPFVWGFYDAGVMDGDRHFYHFTSTDEFVDFIRDKEFIIYAHNGGKFDYHYLRDYIEPYDPITVINGRLARFHIGIAEFRDSWNILPVPLAAYEKQEQDFSIHEREERNKPENWARILEYLESDCVNLYNVVTAYRNRFGSVLTQAAGAMRELNRHNRCPMPRHKTPKFYDDYHRFYYGGRVETFRAGIIQKPFEVVDINSAYPFAMMHVHPYGFETYAKPRDEMTRAEVETSFFTVRCRSRGAFPWKDPEGQIENGALVFPYENELREFNVTGWELLAAEETDTVSDVEILSSYTFEQTTDFRAFVETLWNERKAAKAAGDKAGDLLAKLALNSCYGKFAVNPRRFKDYELFPVDKVGWLHPDNKDDWKDKVGRQWSFAGWFGQHVLGESKLPPEQWKFYNVATAASITGFVRAFLWRAIWASRGVLYCDTDSIAAEKPAVELGPELGQWEREGRFTEAYIGGKKLYAFRYCDSDRPIDRHGNRIRYKVASKGVKLGPMEIRKIAQGEAVTFFPEVPTYRVSGFVDKDTGEKQIARYIPRTVRMLDHAKKRLTK